MKKIRIMAAIAAMLTCISVFLYLDSNGQTTSGTNTTAVVVAAKPIAVQTKITDEMLEIKKMPSESVHPSAVLKKEDVIGKISKTEIVEKEVLLQQKFMDTKETQAGLAFSIPKGMRAVTLSVDKETGLAGLLNRGNSVDIISILPYQAGDKPQNKAILLLQKVEVLALGGTLNSNPKETAEAYETVTVAVKPQDAIRIALAAKEGCYKLVLRPQNDDENAKVTNITIKDIVG